TLCRVTIAKSYHAPAPRPNASGSGFELLRDFSGDFRPPFFHWLEARQGAAVGLGLAEQLVLRLVEVDRKPAGLRDVPRRVANNLDAMALRVVEIDRPGVAVADRAEALAARRAHF